MDIVIFYLYNANVTENATSVSNCFESLGVICFYLWYNIVKNFHLIRSKPIPFSLFALEINDKPFHKTRIFLRFEFKSAVPFIRIMYQR